MDKESEKRALKTVLPDKERWEIWTGKSGSLKTICTAQALATYQAAEQDTLKSVGKALKKRLKFDISMFTHGFMTLGEIESLEKGEFPASLKQGIKLEGMK